jgi:hypothetical protein
VRVGTAIRQGLTLIQHEANRLVPTDPDALFDQIVPGGADAALRQGIDEFGRLLGFEAKLAGVKEPAHVVTKVIDHVRGDNAHVRFRTGLNEEVHLNLGQIAKQPVFVLAGDGADFVIENQVKQPRHTGAFADRFHAAHALILMNEQDPLSRPAQMHEIGG